MPDESGAEAQWNSYLIAPGSDVLRNKLGLTSADALRAAENDLLELRLAQLRAEPGLVSRTYDLPHLKALHFQLFQDVYDWAGELRTVGIAKDGGDSFAPPGSIALPVGHVAQKIVQLDLLRELHRDDLTQMVTYLYDYLNFAHPFREGNGRTQREFFAQLLAESHRGLAWGTVTKSELHDACHRARNEGDLKPLAAIIATALTAESRY